jgi:hypothetical protein
MNSEFLKEVAINSELVENKAIQAENLAIVEANDIESFLNQPMWKKIETNIKQTKEKLYRQLETCDTVKKMQAIQAELKVLNLIINNPKGYLLKRDEIIKRRNKWKNQIT